jgi:hypothetical protein
MEYIFTLLFILLFFTMVGMIVGLLVRTGDMYHGPNAQEFSKRIFYRNSELPEDRSEPSEDRSEPSEDGENMCYRFQPRVIKCPRIQTKLDTMMDHLVSKFHK